MVIAPRLKHAAKLVLMSVFLSGVSSCVPGKVIDIVPGSDDCHAGCLADAAGWPLAYIVDGHGLSPHGSADFIGMLLGVDRLDGLRAVFNCLFWLVITAAVWKAFASWRRRLR